MGQYALVVDTALCDHIDQFCCVVELHVLRWAPYLSIFDFPFLYFVLPLVPMSVVEKTDDFIFLGSAIVQEHEYTVSSGGVWNNFPHSDYQCWSCLVLRTGGFRASTTDSSPWCRMCSCCAIKMGFISHPRQARQISYQQSVV